MRRLRASLPLRRVGNFDNSGFRIRARLDSGYQSLLGRFYYSYLRVVLDPRIDTLSVAR